MTPGSTHPAPHERTGAVRSAGRDRWLIAAVPALLIVVAATQMVPATTTTLTPWRGGGFGMFSTVDVHDLRAVTVQVELSSGEVLPVDIRSFRGDRRIDDAYVTARAWPADRHIERLVSVLTATTAVIDEGTVRHPVSTTAEGLLVVDWPDTAATSVTVTRIEFDRESGHIAFSELASVTVRR